MATASSRRERLLTAGAWLREQRKWLHLTQEELARMIGVSNASLSAYERGVSAPDDVAIEALARVTRQPVGEVRARWGLYNSGDEPTTPPPAPSVIEAILADQTLLPEAREHLTNQYRLLQRLQAAVPAHGTAEHDRAVLARELRDAVNSEESDGSRTVTDTGRTGG